MKATSSPHPLRLVERLATLSVAVVAILSCASIDQGRFGVTTLEVRGNQAVDDAALKACLITRARPSAELSLGVSGSECGVPPFDSSPPTLRLWRWPWTDWPAFNEAIFEEDLQRVTRFYRARGYYDARVTDVQISPPQAREAGRSFRCDPETESCEVSLLIAIDEGQPTLVDAIEMTGLQSVAPDVVRDIEQHLPIRRGAPIDEADYERGKELIVQRLRDAGYAAASTEGSVDVQTKAQRARVRYAVTPGPVYRFGRVRVSGQGTLPSDGIEAAAGIRSGDRYSPQALRTAQGEVFALGAFAAVQVRERLDEGAGRADVDVEVTPLRPNALRVSVGIMSGAIQRTSSNESESVPQWDGHIAASYELRHVFDTLGTLRVEDRPRVVFQRDFPRLTTPTLSNILKVGINQPGLIEARTDTFFESSWDFGPDPYLQFRRDDILFRLGIRRGFFQRRLSLTLALQQDLFWVDPSPANVSSDGRPQDSYDFSFIEGNARLDLRNDRVRPRSGAYFALTAAQSARWVISDWTALRLLPELRAYIPVWWDIVWANRVLLGSLFILSANPDLHDASRRLGPTTYRLRGGGANSNRGFLAGTLGSGLTGGIRRWEANSELRIPIGDSFVIAGFFDVGDVNDQAAFRFSHLNATVGHGLRYHTALGAIRLDFGYRLVRLQRVGGQDVIAADSERLPFGNIPGAIHLTLGDAF